MSRDSREEARSGFGKAVFIFILIGASIFIARLNGCGPAHPIKRHNVSQPVNRPDDLGFENFNQRMKDSAIERQKQAKLDADNAFMAKLLKLQTEHPTYYKMILEKGIDVNLSNIDTFLESAKSIRIK